MIPNIDTVLNKYGWKAEYIPGGAREIKIFNRKGNHAFTIKHWKLTYVFTDTGGNKILSGRGQLNKSLEKVLTQYYYCQPLTETI